MTAAVGSVEGSIRGTETSARLAVCAAICTHGRPEQLRRALRSLVAQNPAPAEILVIDNAPSDDRTRTLVADEFPAVRYCREPIEGLNFARNRALRESTQEILAFVDDDAVADPGWVAGVERAFWENPGAGVCTGRILPLTLETEAQRLFEANGGLFAGGAQRLRLPDDPQGGAGWRRAPYIAWAISVGSGCNLAVRRDLILQLGGFDEALDMGQVLPGGGDNDIVWRALEAGVQVVYEPAARVRHEHRRELDAAYAQIAGHHRAMIALVTKAAAQTPGARRLGVLAFLSWRLAKPGVRLLRRAVGRDPLPTRVLLTVWWSCLQGLVAYPRARRVARRRREQRIS